LVIKVFQVGLCPVLLQSVKNRFLLLEAHTAKGFSPNADNRVGGGEFASEADFGHELSFR
jgi:hypothetical protein